MDCKIEVRMSESSNASNIALEAHDDLIVMVLDGDQSVIDLAWTKHQATAIRDELTRLIEGMESDDD
jgi:hypothetical protein